MKKAALVSLLLLTSLIFSACATTTKEGIPLTLFEDKQSREAITFYRDYLASTSIVTLQNVRKGNIDAAIKLQHYLIDKIIEEISSRSDSYSLHEQKIAARILENIHDHYAKYPRNKSHWFKMLELEKKQHYETVDGQLAESLRKLTGSLPERKLKDDEYIVAGLVFMSYMTGVAIEAIENIYEADENEVLKNLEYVLDHLVSDLRLHARKRSQDLKDEGLKSLAVSILTKIARYRKEHPRCFDKWYLALPKGEREDCEKIDKLLKVASSSHQIYSWDYLLNS